MDLKETYGSRFLIFEDESYKAEKDKGKEKNRWRYYELRGSRGYVYPYSWGKLIAVFTSNKIANRLRNRDGWKVLQDAKDTVSFFIPEKDRELVFTLLKIKRRRTLSTETKRKRIENLNKQLKGNTNVT